MGQWSKVTTPDAKKTDPSKLEIASDVFFNLDSEKFEQMVFSAPERSSKKPGKKVYVPNAKGELEEYEIWSASNFTEQLQSKFPSIQSFVGKGITDSKAYLRFSYSKKGFSGMVLRSGKSEFIEPFTTDGKTYIIFDSKEHRKKGEIPFECSTPETSALYKEAEDIISKSDAGVFKTYRLALSVSGEYTAHFGGTIEDALIEMNNTMTRVNGIFEKDFSIRLLMIDNEDIIYINSTTDPYGSNSSYTDLRDKAYNPQLHRALRDVVGFENYDIGHLFLRGSSNGSAGCIGCICVNVDQQWSNEYGADVGKGAGFTSHTDPRGDKFDVDFVAHEIGHQLGANHTFSFGGSYGTEVPVTGVEPGSGSSIMGYAGITPWNVQNNSDDYFTYRSIQQVQNNLQNKPCGTNTTLTQTPPEVDAGPDYYIPKGTAFVLTGSASDLDGDQLLYNWEQNDPGTSATIGANSRVSPTKTIGPNFRSHPSVDDTIRYMPKFDYVLEGQLTSTAGWESITTVPRNYRFTFTARDFNPEGPQTNTDEMIVRATQEGPFIVTFPEEGEEIELSSNNIEIKWNVAGTNSGQINTQNVKISLSTDNGESFIVLNESTPNDGIETLSFPSGSVETENARIMIQAVDNIYYALSPKFKLTGELSLVDLDPTTLVYYPNPVKDILNIQHKENIERIEIYDLSGKRVLYKKKGDLNKINLSSLPSGSYLVRIYSQDNSQSFKIIKI